MRRDIEFDAEGLTLRGWFYVPDGAKKPVPTEVDPDRETAGAAC